MQIINNIRNPEYFWGFYGYRLNMYQEKNPHYGFQVLKKISNLKNFSDYFIITSNVDGHFQKASFDKEKIYEIHGTINYLQCNSCSKLYPSKSILVLFLYIKIIKYLDFQLKVNENFEAEGKLPTCLNCKGNKFKINT